MSLRRTLLILFGLVLVPQVSSAQDALVRKGQQIYTARKCSMCHSVAGKGNPKGVLEGVGSRWKAEEIRQWIVNWKDMAAKHQATRKPAMPDYSKLPKDDVDALVAFLQSLK